MSDKILNRRQFMHKASAAAAAFAVAGTSTRRSFGANDRLGVGLIGCGGRGNSHLQTVHWLATDGKEAIDIVAVSDTFKPRMTKAAEGYKAKPYSDYRDLLKDPNVDVVCIATCDHQHGYQAIDAVKAGKDVYCEKPITHWRQFELTKRLAEEVKKSGRVFQAGTQGMSDSAWHQMKKLVKEGLIGQPVFGETGYFRIGDFGERGMRIDDPDAKPGNDLNWQAFLGDRTKRPFNVDRFFRWRLFMDYAGGPVTDLYPHCLTQVIDILGVGFPESVVALGGIHRYDYELREVPDTFNLIAQYPEKVTISVVGTIANDFNSLEGDRGAGNRQPIIRGWEGALNIRRNKEIVFIPRRTSGAKEPRTIPIEYAEDNIQHWRNLIECCRKRNKYTWSPMDLAFRTQTVLQMAMQAYLAKKTVKFDAQKRQII